MRIAIVSDLHIGYERFYEDAYSQAKEALHAAGETADAIILPGDIFDRRNPHPDAIGQAISLFRDISRKEWGAKVVEFITYTDTQSFTTVPVIAIPGTHERVAEGKENPLGLLGLAGLLVDASESRVTIEKDGERVSVFGLGGLSEERVKPTLAELSPKPVRGNFNIFMFHQSIYELLPFSDDFIRFDDLPNGFDLYVDGHIHNRIVDQAHGKPFLIPGSTVLTQLKEGEQEPKGFFVYDTKANTYEFNEIRSRPFSFVRIKMENTTPKELTARCEEAINAAIRASKVKPIVKLFIEGTIADGFRSIDMNTRPLQQKFAQDAYIEVDMRLADKDLQSNLSAVREGKVEGMSVRDLGMRIFSARLAESGFDKGVNVTELFNALSSPKKEKALSDAAALFEASATGSGA